MLQDAENEQHATTARVWHTGRGTLCVSTGWSKHGAILTRAAGATYVLYYVLNGPGGKRD
jgi:hypothetical protein